MPVITIIFWNSAGYCPCCSLFYHQFLDFAMAPNHDWRPCNSMHQLHQLLIPMAPRPEMLGWGIDLYSSQRFKHYFYLFFRSGVVWGCFSRSRTFFRISCSVMLCPFSMLFAAFWSWKLPFQRHLQVFEFEPLICQAKFATFWCSNCSWNMVGCN